MSTMYNTNQSVLSCFQAYNKVAAYKWNKSLQLGHTCAITDYHNSCKDTDCTCIYTNIKHVCTLIHFSTNNNVYKNMKFDNSTKHPVTEVYRMLYGNSSYVS